MAKNDIAKRPGNKPASVNLTVRIASEEYVLGTLSFNEVKQEFSYHFHYPEDSPEIHLNCNTSQHTARLDHITWHQKVVHIKRGDGVPIERIELFQGPLCCDRSIVAPLYVETLYFSDYKHCFRKMDQFIPWKESQIQRILDLPDSEGFSVIFVLAPSTTTTADLLLGKQFLKIPEGMEFPPRLVDLCDEQHRTGRIQLWNGWDLIILTSSYKCRIRSPIPNEIARSYRLSNYINVPSAITDLLMQANNLIKIGEKLFRIKQW